MLSKNDVLKELEFMRREKNSFKVYKYGKSVARTTKENLGRWGEVVIEKGPGVLFPTEPTDEPFMVRRP